MSQVLQLLNANEKNLKNISLELPINKIIAVTGISGSGKSTLMFDVILKEYFRREKIINNRATDYDKYCRPDFEKFFYLNKVIGINQKSLLKSEVSTVSTVSGVNEIIKQLFVKFGKIHCSCGNYVPSTCDIKDVFSKILSTNNTKLKILYKIKDSKDDIKINIKTINAFNIEKFYNDQIKKINIKVDGTYKNESIYGEINSSLLNRDDIEVKKILLVENSEMIYDFSIQTFCNICDEEYLSIRKSLFTRSKISKINGCCTKCNGESFLDTVDFESLINNSSVSEKFINLPHNGKAYKYIYLQDKEIFKIIRDGQNDVDFFSLRHDIRDELKKLINEKVLNHKNHEVILKYIRKEMCLDCEGTGFNKYALSIKLDGLNIFQINDLNFIDLKKIFLRDEKIINILNMIEDLSLSYLKLSRSTKTLSGGELQRLKILNALFNYVSNSIIIFDEISSGLSLQDQNKIINVINKLKSQNNTIFLIEHSEYLIENCDMLISIGPESGVNGGSLINNYNYKIRKNILRNKLSSDQKLFFSNVSNNNLKNIDFYFPLNVLTSVIGVSGSGKSSLIASIQNEYKNHKDLNVIYMAQEDLYKSSRSIVATYNEVFDEIRTIYANLHASKLLNLSISNFSPNTIEGSCELCRGKSDSDETICKKCFGTKFNFISLSVSYGKYNIYELLNLSFHEILQLNISKKINKLSEILIKLGVGYLSLGRTTSSLSGGEAQRVKLAKFLLEFFKNNKNKDTLLILDEPSKGLGNTDITMLLELIDDLLLMKCSVIAVEHNEYFIKNSDFLIQIGPKSGPEGGEITFCNYIQFYTFPEKHRTGSEPQIVVNNSLINVPDWMDDHYFKKIKNFHERSSIKSNPIVINYMDENEVLNALSYEKEYFFCPFFDEISHFKSVSKTAFNSIRNTLKSFGFDEYFYFDQKIELKKMSVTYDHKNYLNIFLKTNDINLCNTIGGGVIIIKNGDRIYYHTNRLLDIENIIVGPREINKNYFNKYYSSCCYCGGIGYRKIYDISIFNDEILLDDLEFYKKFNLSKGDLYKIKVSIKKFMEEMIFDFHKKLSDLSDSQCYYYFYGDPYVFFLSKDGRKNALGDRIVWNGLFKILEKYKSIPNIDCECPYCFGEGYIQDINYYLVNGKSIYQYD
ncbi:ATP-binding cassette domain-containing protein [Acinetobacter kyonggiensis]|uniref:UvrABC system protein A n=1 Tax=Acinetobacter kyonggiensis TaxID=595670 RepID=A0A1H3KFZ6_9GAMM|nr:ATP-binding cassette domain-containing protein [Acinetobacter kyonggiensis]SDY51122.1 excinuclease ABC subunit A [Acinetobacter kyonggiensis]